MNKPDASPATLPLADGNTRKAHLSFFSGMVPRRLARVAAIVCVAFQLLALSASATYFADDTYTFSSQNQTRYQDFTLGGTTRVVFRFVSDFQATAAIIPQSSRNSFLAGNSVSTYALFEDQFGTIYVTLGAGSYSIVTRNNVSSSNTFRYELDYDKTFSDAHFNDMYFQESDYVGKNGGTLWQPFTIQSGFRYWMDGANTGLDCHVIPASSLSAWRNGETYSYYPDYSADNSVDLPGGYELNLPPGDYYLAFRNNSSVDKALVYSCERFRVLTYGGGGGNDTLTRAQQAEQAFASFINRGRQLRALYIRRGQPKMGAFHLLANTAKAYRAKYTILGNARLANSMYARYMNMARAARAR